MLITLPEPATYGEKPLEACLSARRSVRDFAPLPLTLEEVGQLLWAAQGLTAEWGGRTAPSAGALYPLELYMVAGEVRGLPQGSYRYEPEQHSLAMVAEGDLRPRLAHAALGQEPVESGAVVLALAAAFQRTTRKYGERGNRYVHMEAGHAAQNVCLQAAALGLGAVPVGAFDDRAAGRLLGLAADEMLLYLIPLGRPH